MEHSEKNKSRILPWAAGMAAGSLLLSLPVFDTVLSFSLRELMTDGDYQRLALGIFAVSFGLEYLFLRAKKWTGLKWSLILLPAACLVFGELFWFTGGWDQIAGLILWWFGFPTLMGAALAVFLGNLPKSRKLRTVVVIAAVILVVMCAVFWPRTLAGQMTLDIGGEMLVYDTDDAAEWRTIRDPGQVEQMLHFSEIVWWPAAPDWKDNRGVLLRLNAEFIVAAENGEAPYIYAYSGPLEDFDGSGAKWRFYYFPALYTELVTAGERTTEETIP